MEKLRRCGIIFFVNGAVFVALFIALELADRIYRDGFRGAFTNILRNSNVPYSNLGTGNWVIYDDELGYRLNPDQTDVNSRSVRDSEILVPKPSGLHRIIVLGDSIPWDRDGFVKLMRDHWGVQGRYEIINASVPGYTTYQELLFFKRYLVQTDPNLVIWSYCLNDNHTFLHRFDEKGRMLVTGEGEESLAIHNYWDFVVSRSYLLTSIWFRIVALKQEHRTQTRSPFVWERLPDFNVAWKEVYWGAYEQYLSEMLELLAERRARLTVVVFPFEPQLEYRHDPVNYDYAVKPQRILLATCEKYNVRCLDLYPVFASSYDQGQKLYRDGLHLNDAGHRLAASTINDFLIANRLLP